MFKKFIFWTQKNHIRLPSKIFHSISIVKDIFQSWCNLQKRSDVFFQRAITYIPYLQSEEWMKCLLCWLDEKNTNFIKEILARIEYIAIHNYVDYNQLILKHDITEQDLYISYVDSLNQSNYFKKNWLWLMNEYYIWRDISKYSSILSGKDILDCWAFIWDSSIALSDFLPESRIIALEPDSWNFTKLNEIVSLHQKNNKIITINEWVWEIDSVWYIDETWLWSKLSDTWTKISIRSIDSLVKEHSLTPGLIKRDIEWFEYFSVLWSLDTIKKYKPILFISVYHHWRDLFEIKKLLQDLDLGYQFSFTRRDCMLPFADTLLVAFPSSNAS